MVRASGWGVRDRQFKPCWGPGLQPAQSVAPGPDELVRHSQTEAIEAVLDKLDPLRRDVIATVALLRQVRTDDAWGRWSIFEVDSE